MSIILFFKQCGKVSAQNLAGSEGDTGFFPYPDKKQRQFSVFSQSTVSACILFYVQIPVISVSCCRDHRILSDIQKIAELFQCSVCLMCKHTFCKNLTKLYAFLVKAVYVPYKSLEHDLVLKVCQKRSKSLRCQ